MGSAEVNSFAIEVTLADTDGTVLWHHRVEVSGGGWATPEVIADCIEDAGKRTAQALSYHQARQQVQAGYPYAQPPGEPYPQPGPGGGEAHHG